MQQIDNQRAVSSGYTVLLVVKKVPSLLVIDSVLASCVDPADTTNWNISAKEYVPTTAA